MNAQNGHYHPVNGQNEGIALAHTVYGQPVTATALSNNVGSNIGPATWSTAPYKRRSGDSPGKPLCNADGCTAFPMKREFLRDDGSYAAYCTGHARGMGLIPNWSKKKVADGDAD